MSQTLTEKPESSGDGDGVSMADPNRRNTELQTEPSVESATAESATTPTPARHKSPSNAMFWLGVISVAALFGSWIFPRVSFLIFTLANFQWQLVFLIGLAALFCLKNRKYKSAIALVGCIAWPLFNFGMMYTAPPAVEPATKAIRLMTFNVFQENTRFIDTLAMIKQVDADVVGLVEFHEPWEKAFDGKLPEYKYQIGPKGGKIIFSKIPITELETKYKFFDPLYQTWLETRLKVEDQNLHFSLVHAVSPKSRWRQVLRNSQYYSLGRLANYFSRRMHVVVAGDFNGTTHDHNLSSMLDEAGLKDSRQGFGWQNSWPTWCWPMSVCIDHCFVSKGVQVVDRRLGPNTGSDHLPVIVDLRFSKHPRNK